MTHPDPLGLILRAILGDPVSRSQVPQRQTADVTAAPGPYQQTRQFPGPLGRTPEIRQGQSLGEKWMERVDLVARVLSTPYDIARSAPEALKQVRGGDIAGGLVHLGVAALPGPSPRGVPKSMEELLSLPHTELETAIESIRRYERTASSDVFGKEMAERYEKAQRVVNSSTIDFASQKYRDAEALIARLEANLTEAQQRRLFGIGETVPSFEEVRELGRMGAHYAPARLAGESTDELVQHFAALAGGQRRANDPVVLYGLQRIYQELARRKVGDESIVAATLARMGRHGVDPQTAGEYLASRMSEWRNKGQP